MTDPIQSVVVQQDDELTRAATIDQDDFESVPYRISFASYDNDECEIDSLVKNNGKKILKVLKTIGSKKGCQVFLF